ncbi:hypothetical protein X798_02585 [Onchocerca flexuosa]|uniref:Transposase n=2 Tax=Onchocerca flexuosa TaxID=387005 RepID=A0A183GYE7_9BILA|nr:hypothetical protein X798_02585 [Onchocerca flexuosa]VDO25162.1 unnamed protein product [Onchocerca flexuosa]
MRKETPAPAFIGRVAAEFQDKQTGEQNKCTERTQRLTFIAFHNLQKGRALPFSRDGANQPYRQKEQCAEIRSIASLFSLSWAIFYTALLKFTDLR